MLVRSHFNVLVVDDEPDVLSITKIALRNIKVWNIPIKLQTCSSKAEAVKYVSALGPVPDLALALIDVVMETDEAGLELCKYIRSECKNYITPLVVRTGQAGKAPERQVIDRYDISQYVTKVESTEDRLYTIVKSSVRQFLEGRAALALSVWLCNIIEHSKNRSSLLEALEPESKNANLGHGGQTVATTELHHAFFIEDRMAGIGDYKDLNRAQEGRKMLLGKSAIADSPFGTVRREGDQILLSLPAGKGPSIDLLTRTNFNPVPDAQADLYFGFLQVIQRLWNNLS